MQFDGIYTPLVPPYLENYSLNEEVLAQTVEHQINAAVHGMDDQALEFFAWGARSWVCAGSNFAPKAHIAFFERLRT